MFLPCETTWVVYSPVLKEFMNQQRVIIHTQKKQIKYNNMKYQSNKVQSTVREEGDAKFQLRALGKGGSQGICNDSPVRNNIERGEVFQDNDIHQQRSLGRTAYSMFRGQ